MAEFLFSYPTSRKITMVIVINLTMTNNLIKTDCYQTHDLALATVISLSYPIEAIDRQNPRKAEFLFKREVGLDTLIESYWRGELKVEPQTYFNQLRIIKARLYGDE